MSKLPRDLGASHLHTWKSASDYAWLSGNMNDNENIKYDNEPASKGFGGVTFHQNGFTQLHGLDSCELLAKPSF